MKRVLFWSPRILALLFAAFITIFTLDVFGKGYSFGELLIALAMHLIPTALILIALIAGWRWSWAGALLFAALGVGYLLMGRGRTQWSNYLIVSGPAFLIAVLFLVDWLFGRRKGATVRLDVPAPTSF
jgi:hypothetical protein